MQRSQLTTIGPVAIASPNLQIPRAPRFECNPFPVGRKVRPPFPPFLRYDLRRGALTMFFVPQVQSPDVAGVIAHLLVNELIAFGRNGRTYSPHTGTCSRPWRSSGSGYAPQPEETSTRGREHDIAAVRSPSGRRPQPSIVVCQPLGCATCGGHDIEVRHHTRNNPPDESHGRAVGRESRAIIDLLIRR